MKILTFPFAGGNKYSYQNLSSNLPNFKILEYSQERIVSNESRVLDLSAIIDDLMLRIRENLKDNKEYIIYGHSMGALFGFLICQKIEELKLPRPLKLVVSGFKAPSIKRKKIISHLPDIEFWDEIIKLGGVTAEMKDYPELIEYYIPILRADFKTVENYMYTKMGKLSIPIDVFYGSNENIKEEEAFLWKKETIGEVNIIQLEGGHFFIFDHIDYFVKYFKNLSKKYNQARD